VLTTFEFAPAAGSVVGDDLFEHRGKGARVDHVALEVGDCPGGLIAVTGRDDALGVRDDRAVVEKEVDVISGANSAQTFPSSTKYGRTVRLIVSTTSASAA
jgi:hypothetical protein